MENLLLSFRKRLREARSKEEMRTITQELLRELPSRYKPLSEFLSEGNADIEERLDFLLSEVAGDFLDVGSYDGFFVFELEKKGRRAVGVDMMGEAFAHSMKEREKRPDSQAEFCEAYAEALPFPDETFDTVIVSHTLEHVFDPAQVLEEAARVTREGGKIIVIVPTELGNDPTHVRVVDPLWLAKELALYGIVSDQKTVGDGISFVCTKASRGARVSASA